MSIFNCGTSLQCSNDLSPYHWNFGIGRSTAALFRAGIATSNVELRALKPASFKSLESVSFSPDLLRWYQMPVLNAGFSPDGKMRFCLREPVLSQSLVVHGNSEVTYQVAGAKNQIATISTGIVDQGPICEYGAMRVEVTGVYDKGQEKLLGRADLFGYNDPGKISFPLAGIETLSVRTTRLPRPEVWPKDFKPSWLQEQTAQGVLLSME